MSTTTYDELADRLIALTEEFLPFAREETERCRTIHSLRQREGRTLGKRRENLIALREIADQLLDASVTLLGGSPAARERRRLELARTRRLTSR